MRQTVYFSKALRIWICVICALIIISIYPLRLFRRTHTTGTSEAPRFVSEAVNDIHVIRQYFRAQFDKIDSVSVYVSSLDAGRYMAVALQKDGYSSICSRYIDLQNETVPGYVRVKLGVALEPGEKYNILLKGKLSTFRTAYFSYEENPVPGMETYLNDWEPVPGGRLAFSLTYDLPLSKQVSLVLMGGVLLTAVLLNLFIFYVFRKKPEADRLLMVGDVVRYPLSVLLVLFFGTLFIMNMPLHLFEDDPLEVGFYAIGILVGAAVCLYALNRFCTDEKQKDSLNLREWIAAALLAMALKYACDYMNGVFNLEHYITARQMMICLLLMVLMLFPFRVLRNPILLAAVAVSTVLSVIWAKGVFVSPDDVVADLLILEIRLTAAVAVLSVYVPGCILTEWIYVKQKKPASPAKGTPFDNKRRFPFYLGWTLLFAVCFIAFRNTRLWIPAFVALYALVCLGARRSVLAGRWIRIVQNGVYLHFFCSMIYCLLHRAFQNLVFFRFGFVFSTVTVTAQYMNMICAIATVGLITRLKTYQNEKDLRVWIRASWKEIVVFALSVSYMLFTISRLSIVSVTVLILLVLAVVAVFGAGMRLLIRSLVCMTVSVVLIFPAAFTLQRIMPALCAEHEPLPAIEDVSGYPFHEDWTGTSPFLLGKVEYDSAVYMRIKRFIHVMNSRFFGADEVYDMYFCDKNNYDENNYAIYGINGELIPDGYYEELINQWQGNTKSENNAQSEINTSSENNTPSENHTASEMNTSPESNMSPESNTASEINTTAEINTDMENNTISGSGVTDCVEASDAGTEISLIEEVSDVSDNEIPSLPSVPEDAGTDVSNGRFEIYKSYLENLNMTGHIEMTNENTVGPHAHNIYLQVAFDCGIPVAILFFGWIGLTIIGAFSGYVKYAKGQTPSDSALASSFLWMFSLSVCFAVTGLFDWSFHLANPCTLIFMMGITPLMFCSGRT